MPPLIIALVLVLTLLRPAIKTLRPGKHDTYLGHYMLATMAIGIPAAITQDYMLKATGRLTALETITQYPAHKPSKYYNVHNFYAGKSQTLIDRHVYTSGKYKAHYNLDLYMVVPVWASEKDTATLTPYWLANTYKLNIRNNLSGEDQDKVFGLFTGQSIKDFEQADLHRYTYWEILPGGVRLDRYRKMIKDAGYATDITPLVFQLKEGRYTNRTGKQICWVFGSMGIGIAIWLFVVLAGGRFRSEQRRF